MLMLHTCTCTTWVHVRYMYVLVHVFVLLWSTGHAVFVPHAMLLRGAMHTLWREDDKALKDFQDVINAQGLSPEVCAHMRQCIGTFPPRYVHIHVCINAQGLSPEVCAHMHQCAGNFPRDMHT